MTNLLDNYCGYCGRKDTFLYGGVCEDCNPQWEQDNPKESHAFARIREEYNRAKENNPIKG